jgi:hypothetical protein
MAVTAVAALGFPNTRDTVTIGIEQSLGSPETDTFEAGQNGDRRGRTLQLDLRGIENDAVLEDNGEKHPVGVSTSS